ncbi:threonine--tRNA ligase [Holospora curviuscula]|uniref:Threonine--tRNA ligase n=1 Tax=Holospora curviuscula TaxID=1082868 RepID=A0A2S5RHY3_9PROT|nr:threonine--tRNA ligase [Holospora curviuscula]PPE06920.1 Threonine--tRNA ligase [Holospora curviuscula]
MHESVGTNGRVDLDMRYVACQVGTMLVDLTLHQEGALVERWHPKGLEVLRHTAAHVLAQAVKRLYPDTQVTIGPVIEEGFYYDFLTDRSFQPSDLLRIEAEMHQIVSENLPIQRSEWSEAQAISYFLNRNEPFKAQIIRDLPKEGALFIYTQGEFIDLCRGPHCPSTGYLKDAFKLLRVSGAYWRGDAKGQPLQRIYGTAWAEKKDLEAYLYRIEEAEKRDHRKIGKAMDLYHFQDLAPGCIFWHPYGWRLHLLLQEYIRERLGGDYREVNTPQLVSRSLWQASGHWDQYHENMFVLGDLGNEFALKPMNCPCHVQIFNQGTKSYKELPLRFSEFGSCHRNEPSGALSGLMRARNFVQDDAHIFCTPEQISSETQKFCHLLHSVYSDLGFHDVLVRFATRPEKRLGDDTLWDQAEESLKEGAEKSHLNYTLHPGEGAFYGPKLEFTLKDSLGRLWQCGTLQVDFVLPGRLGAFYVDSGGKQKPTVMLHRAILGSFERFMGIMLEHYSGKLPLWLAPVQLVICSISEKAENYSLQVLERFKNAGFRVELDCRNEKISNKIRHHSLRKVGCIGILGLKEASQDSVNLRIGQNEEVMTISDAIDRLKEVIFKKSIL